MSKRLIARVILVVGFAAGALIGLGSPADAGKLCVEAGMPNPLPDITVCIPTY